jgi:hypothetical protein
VREESPRISSNYKIETPTVVLPIREERVQSLRRANTNSQSRDALPVTRDYSKN